MEILGQRAQSLYRARSSSITAITEDVEGSRRSHSSHRGEGVPAAPARKQSRHSSKARATKDKEGEKIRLVWANDEEDVFHVRGEADAHARRKHHKRISTIAAAVCGVVMLAVVGLCVGVWYHKAPAAAAGTQAVDMGHPSQLVLEFTMAHLPSERASESLEGMLGLTPGELLSLLRVQGLREDGRNLTMAAVITTQHPDRIISTLAAAVRRQEPLLAALGILAIHVPAAHAASFGGETRMIVLDGDNEALVPDTTDAATNNQSLPPSAAQPSRAALPTPLATAQPTPLPTPEPSQEPTQDPTQEPTQEPTRPAGWSCADSPCRHGGQCTGSATVVAMVQGRPAFFSCACSPGFQGALCEGDIDECAVASRLLARRSGGAGGAAPPGGGAAVLGRYMQKQVLPAATTGDDQFVRALALWQHSEGYSGQTGPCGLGWCEDGIAEYTCHCIDGIEGKDCSHNIDDCGPLACAHADGEEHGDCVDFIGDFGCRCWPGWTGPACDSSRTGGG